MNQLLKIGENYLLLCDRPIDDESTHALRKMWHETFPGVGLAVMPMTKFYSIEKVTKLLEEADAKEED